MRRFNRLKILCMSSSALISMNAPIFVTSCNDDNINHYDVGRIDGKDWLGVTRGSFLSNDYVIDAKKKTITYISAVGIHAYNLVIPNFIIYENARLKVLIGDNCFANTIGISGSIQLNDFIVNIPPKCFYSCVSLAGLIFKKKPRLIGTLAFANCPILSKILVLESGSLTDEWCSNIMAIDDFAFSNCLSLSGDLIFGSPLSYIGEYCFNECIGLSSVNFIFANNLTRISAGAFNDCNGLRELIISSATTHICKEAFQGCRLLKTVELPINNMHLTLGDSAFLGCDNLSYFTKPIIFESIGSSCFSFDVNLRQNYWEPKYGIQYIPKNAFASCNLGYISFSPDKLVEVGDYAFSNNDNLCVLDFSLFGSLPAPSWHGEHIFIGSQEKGVVYFDKTTTFTSEWREFFFRNDIQIDQQHWQIKVV